MKQPFIFKLFIISRYLTIFLKSYKENTKKYISSGEFKKMDNAQLWQSLLKLITDIVYDYEKEMEQVGIPKVVVEKMKESHFLLLPTVASEGFPKVIAEAWSNSCLPIVSDVSCIAQYVKDAENGYLVDHLNLACSFNEKARAALDCGDMHFQLMVSKALMNINIFSYDHYQKQIQQHFLLN